MVLFSPRDFLFLVLGIMTLIIMYVNSDDMNEMDKFTHDL